jgi:hypothetical protein
VVREELVCESVVDVRRVEDVTRLVAVRSDGEDERRDAAGIGKFKNTGPRAVRGGGFR